MTTKVWFQFEHAAAPVQLNADTPIRMRDGCVYAALDAAEVGAPVELYQYESWRKGHRVREPRVIELTFKMRLRDFGAEGITRRMVAETVRGALLRSKECSGYDGFEVLFDESKELP